MKDLTSSCGLQLAPRFRPTGGRRIHATQPKEPYHPKIPQIPTRRPESFKRLLKVTRRTNSPATDVDPLHLNKTELFPLCSTSFFPIIILQHLTKILGRFTPANDGGEKQTNMLSGRGGEKKGEKGHIGVTLTK